jgi:hypothetical protein
LKFKLIVLNLTKKVLVCHMSNIPNSGVNYSRKLGEG